MLSRRVSIALSEGLRALSSVPTKELSKASLADCALALSVLPGNAELADTRAHLARRLQARLTPAWIKTGNADEVFAVLAALWRYEPTLITGEHLAMGLQRLVAAELTAGGPYHFEPAVIVPAHINIAIFMRSVTQPLPNVEAFLARVIAGRFKDMRLDNRSSLYLLAYIGGSPSLTAYIEYHWSQQPGQNPVSIATALVALRQKLPANHMQRVLQALCDQQKEGFWPGDTAGDNSRFITTAIVVSALTTLQPPAKTDITLRSRQKVIATAAQHMFASCAEPLRTTGLTAVNRTVTADTTFEITLLPLLFAKALKTPDTLSLEQHKNLGLASLYGWIAYTIYDDFLDDHGQPAALPVANVAMRASLDCFRMALPTHNAFARDVSATFCTMDEANAWEVRHCRFAVSGGEVTVHQLPKYKSRAVLAERSLAHTLAPLAVLQLCLPNNRQRHTRLIKTALTQYLIARQLNDDIRDWPDDMQNGHASYVVAALLRDLRIQPGTYAMANLLPAMHRSFRRKVLPKMCRYILQHTTASREAFQRSQLLHKENNFYALLGKLEQAAAHSLDGRTKSLAFYNAIKTNKLVAG